MTVNQREAAALAKCANELHEAGLGEVLTLLQAIEIGLSRPDSTIFWTDFGRRCSNC